MYFAVLYIRGSGLYVLYLRSTNYIYYVYGARGLRSTEYAITGAYSRLINLLMRFLLMRRKHVEMRHIRTKYCM